VQRELQIFGLCAILDQKGEPLIHFLAAGQNNRSGAPLFQIVKQALGILFTETVLDIHCSGK